MTKEMEATDIDAIAVAAETALLARITAGLGAPVRIDDPIVVAGLAAIAASLPDVSVPPLVVVYDSPEALLRAVGETRLDGFGVDRLRQLIMYDEGLRAQQWWDEGVHPRHPDGTPDLTGYTHDEPSLGVMIAFSCLVYDGIWFDDRVVLVGWPSVWKTDDRRELHCADGPALLWPGEQEHYWHGQAIDEIVINRPDDVTGEYLLKLSAEQRRASYEAIGHERAIKALGLTAIDTATIGDLAYELYRGSQESWLRMQSPPLQDGSQPFYVEPVHELVATCREALAWRVSGDLEGEVAFEVET